MDRLLRKKDIVEAVGIAKSTVADWVTEFHMYIPTVKQGAVTYYRSEALDVLNAIREMREMDYAKPQIMELLAKRGFPITVEEAVQDVQRILSQSDARDTLLNVMQTMGQAVVEIGKQTDRLNRHEERISEQVERLDGQDGRIQIQEKRLDGYDGELNEVKRIIQDLAQQLAEAKYEAATANERAEKAEAEAKKPFWKKIF